MVASIGVIASPSQGAGYYERDGYYAKDDPAHRAVSAWDGKGAAALGLCGPVEPGAFQGVLEGQVPDGLHLGKAARTGRSITARAAMSPFSGSKSVSLLAMVGGDERSVDAHDRAVGKMLARVERSAVETRIQEKATGAMIRAGGQKMVAATFRHGIQRKIVRSATGYPGLRFLVVN